MILLWVYLWGLIPALPLTAFVYGYVEGFRDHAEDTWVICCVTAFWPVVFIGAVLLLIQAFVIRLPALLGEKLS